MKKKVLVLLLGVLLFNSCATNSELDNIIPPGARPIFISDVMVGGGFVAAAVLIITVFDPDVDATVVTDMLHDIDDDDNLFIYWVPSSNNVLSRLSRQTGNLNGSVVFAKWSLQYSANTLKRMGRSREAAKAADEQLEETEDMLTDEELEMLIAAKDSYTEEEEIELKKSYIYLTLASTSLINVPIIAADLISQIAGIIADPVSLVMQNPFELPLLLGQAKSINDNLWSISKESPDVIKNLNSTIQVIKKIRE